MSQKKKNVPRIHLGYKAGHGNRQRYIASKISLVINEQLLHGGNISINFPIKELRELTAKKLCKDFGLKSLEVINAIRNDYALSENFVLSKLHDIESVTFYSQELMLAFEDAKKKIARNRLRLVA